MEEEKVPKPKAAPPRKAFVSGQSHSHGDAHVTWDEETIALHDMDRGTRMKIEEPNTPYHYYVESDQVGAVSPARSFSGQPSMQWDELQAKLRDVENTTQDEWAESDAESSSSASKGLNFAARDSEGKKIHKDPSFADKRKNHYNEFERVRNWKMQHGEEEDDDGNGGDRDDEEEEKRVA